MSDPPVTGAITDKVGNLAKGFDLSPVGAAGSGG